MKTHINEDVRKIVANAAAINRPISVANVEGCAANGCDKDLADYFAIGKQKVKVADDFEKIMEWEGISAHGWLW